MEEKETNKISLSNKIKISVLTRNIQLGSLKHLPSPLKKNFEKTLKNAIIFYKHNLIKGDIKVLNEKELLILQKPELPKFSEGDLLILVLPQDKIKYVFQNLVEEILPEGYKLKILNPRHDKRLILKEPISAFISFIPYSLFVNFLQKNYFLIRNSNFSLEKAQELKKLQFYDIIFNENNQIDEEFRKAINNFHVNGELLDISSGGLCIKAKGIIQIPENTYLTYTKFDVSFEEKGIKAGLLCDLRNYRFEGKETFFHLAFLISFKPEVWQKIKEILKPLVK